MIKSSLQSVFFSRMADPRAIRKLFEHLPGVYFLVKDRDSRMIAASPAIFERLGVRDEAEMLGKTDGEFFPPHIADGFRSDDNRIFCTGQQARKAPTGLHHVSSPRQLASLIPERNAPWAQYQWFAQ